jgi:pyruvate,orthophosphate dikinase
VPNVFAFDHPHDLEFDDLQHLLGEKGAHLSHMVSVLGLPVPAGFVVGLGAGAVVCSQGLTPELEEELEAHLRTLSTTAGLELGSPDRPLLLSVRAGGVRPMPGALRSVLDIGLNDETVVGLAQSTGDERFALDSYRRLIEMYSTTVLGVPAELFEHRWDGAKLLAGITDDADVPVEVLRLVIERYHVVVESATGALFPQDPREQLRGAIEAACRSWDAPAARNYRRREGMDEDGGIAVSVQRMVFGNRNERSGTGLAFSRDPLTGQRTVYGEFLARAQGLDVGAGEHTLSIAEMVDAFPEAGARLMAGISRLEHAFGDMMAVQFTVEDDELWLLQATPGDRSGRAAVTMAVAMTSDDDLGLEPSDAMLLVTGDHLDQILHPQLEGGRTVLATGLGASPGAAVGKVYFSADAAVEAYDEGDDVILVKDETSPEDVHGMAIAEGILTSKGGMASHAAVVARGWGKPAVCGAGTVDIGTDRFTVGSVVVNEGDTISLDGAAGEVYLGAVDLSEGDVPPEMDVVLGWADGIRSGRMAVRANADNPEDAAKAREFGAEGIGLCRTEHQFLGERLPVVQAMILAHSDDEETAALEMLAEVQRADFIGLFEAMDGLPVTVRLLDPPLHEFLPNVIDLVAAEAKGELDDDGRHLLSAARAHHEENPMLGTRGVRLGILREGLFRMQARALAEAALARRSAGGRPIVEIMVPLIINRAELDLVTGWIEEELLDVIGEERDGLWITIGTMIETPRAAICADVIAPGADFFSFGTNDLTQMTLGFSRDDVESRIMGEYLDRGLLGANPFQTIDRQGVGELVLRAARDARAVDPDIKLGVCGEHGGDPRSIELFAEAGLDYVSCSPYRLPIARLAAAQAIVRADR